MTVFKEHVNIPLARGVSASKLVLLLTMTGPRKLKGVVSWSVSLLYIRDCREKGEIYQLSRLSLATKRLQSAWDCDRKVRAVL